MTTFELQLVFPTPFGTIFQGTIYQRYRGKNPKAQHRFERRYIMTEYVFLEDTTMYDSSECSGVATQASKGRHFKVKGQSSAVGCVYVIASFMISCICMMRMIERSSDDMNELFPRRLYALALYS
eukprot:783409-Prorocentrum_minimum.AAC.3